MHFLAAMLRVASSNAPPLRYLKYDPQKHHRRSIRLLEYDHLPVWQHNYYEHIIRDNPEWDRICEYIQNHHLRWEEGQLHPNGPNYPYEWV